jgi:hypothetical protein
MVVDVWEAVSVEYGLERGFRFWGYSMDGCGMRMRVTYLGTYGGMHWLDKTKANCTILRKEMLKPRFATQIAKPFQ